MPSAQKKIVNARTEGTTPLIEAVKGGHINTATALIDYGADVNLADEYEGRSPLIISTMARSLQVNNFLLQKGADVNQKDRYGRTAIFYAVKFSLSNIVQQLLARNAVVNYKDSEGTSPMDLARRTGNRAIQSMLRKVSGRFDTSSKKSSYSSAERKKIEGVLGKMKRAKKNLSTKDKRLRRFIAPAKLKIGIVDIVKGLIEKGASVEVVNNYGNSVITQLAFKLRQLNNVPKFARVKPKPEQIKEFYELLELVVQKGANPDRKNTKKDRGYTARTIFEGFHNGKINPKFKDEKALAILGGKKVADLFEEKKEPLIDEEKWIQSCRKRNNNSAESKNYCQDELREFLVCVEEMMGQEMESSIAQETCKVETEEIVTVEEAPELEVEKNNWFDNCMRRFEGKTGKLTEDQLEKGNAWCNRMWKDFGVCVSNTNVSKDSADLALDKCQDKIYVSGEKELVPVKEKEVDPEVEENFKIEWEGDSITEITDLKKDEHIKVNLKFIYEGTHSGYKVKFKDIDNDCKKLNLKIHGYKIYGKVPENFTKCEVSVFAYALKVPNVQSRIKSIFFTSEKKKLPTIDLDVKGYGKAPQTVKMGSLKPGEKIKRIDFSVKGLKNRRVKVKYHFDEDKKCVAKNSKKEWLKITVRGTRGFIEGTVPSLNFLSCKMEFKATNILGEFSDKITFELNCPDCKEGEVVKKVLGKSKSFHFMKVPDKWKKFKSSKKTKNEKSSSYPLRSKDKELQKYIDHRNWNASKIKDLVEKEEASANTKNNFGNTVLAMAVIKKDKELVKFLIKHGGDPDIGNKKGFTARKFAERSPEMKGLLKESLKDSVLTKVIGEWMYCDPSFRRAYVYTISKAQQITREEFKVDGSCKRKGLLNSFKGTYRVYLPKLEKTPRIKDQDAFYFDTTLEMEGQRKEDFNLVKIEGDELVIAWSNNSSSLRSRSKKFLSKGNYRFKRVKD